MALKYVEDWRNKDGGGEYSDWETIRRAIHKLSDGDTLSFEKGRTYVLEHPVNFTEYSVDENTPNSEVAYKTRNFLTIDGNGCTVRCASTFITNYGLNPTKALFFVSDDDAHGLNHSVIKNFVFKWNSSDDYLPGDDTHAYKNRSAAIGIITTPDDAISPGEKAMYFSNGVIKNCEFHHFGDGIHLDGETVIIEQCYFEYCYVGINSDCTKHLDVRQNYFSTTIKYGLCLNKSYYSSAYGNYFYQCSNAAIVVEGNDYNRPNDATVLAINIYSNKIYGQSYVAVDENSDDLKNSTGIQCNGVKDVVIRDNIIRNMRHITYTPEEEEEGKKEDLDRGIGILFNDADTDGNPRISERVIVADNIINNCQRYGIKMAYSSSCKITGNSLTSSPYANGEDCGIVVQNTAGDIHVSDNALYYFEKGRYIRLNVKSNEYNVKVLNNTCYNKTVKFDPLSPARSIDNTSVNQENSMIIDIHEISVSLADDEEFYLYVPDDYYSSTVSFIAYDGMTGTVMDSNNTLQTNISQFKGTYLRLKYKYYERANGDFIRFIMCE